jgi:hypothetical protein
VIVRLVIVRQGDRKTGGSQMPDRVRKRPSTAKALARWDDEGGATKGMPQEDRDALISLGQEEAHILRCLGAAVIMQWNDLPTDVQHELFDSASPWASCVKPPSSSAGSPASCTSTTKIESRVEPARLRAKPRPRAARSRPRAAPGRWHMSMSLGAPQHFPSP